MHQAIEKPENWKIARSFPRFAIDVPLIISSGKLESVLHGKIADIGLGGVCGVLTSGQVRVGDRIQLEFSLPGGSGPMTFMAKLKYVVGQRHGFQFLTITPEQRERIRRVCESLVIV